MKQITVPNWLFTKNFVVEYDPNSQKPFMIRLKGYLQACIDKRTAEKTGDAIGFGHTFVEAAENAKKVLKEQKRLGIQRFQEDLFSKRK